MKARLVRIAWITFVGAVVVFGGRALMVRQRGMTGEQRVPLIGTSTTPRRVDRQFADAKRIEACEVHRRVMGEDETYARYCAK